LQRAIIYSVNGAPLTLFVLSWLSWGRLDFSGLSGRRSIPTEPRAGDVHASAWFLFKLLIPFENRSALICNRRNVELAMAFRPRLENRHSANPN
jgi:hypothetical protein